MSTKPGQLHLHRQDTKAAITDPITADMYDQCASDAAKGLPLGPYCGDLDPRWSDTGVEQRSTEWAKACTSSGKLDLDCFYQLETEYRNRAAKLAAEAPFAADPTIGIGIAGASKAGVEAAGQLIGKGLDKLAASQQSNVTPSQQQQQSSGQTQNAGNTTSAPAGTGQAGKNGNIVPRITPGSLPANEAQAVSQTVQHIDNGTQPSGPAGVKWGHTFHNHAGDLPQGTYKEYRVVVQGTPNVLRVVQNTQSGQLYYTWTHYGDTGDPAFVQIR